MHTQMGKLWAKNPNMAKAVIGAAILDGMDSHHIGFSASADEQAYIKKAMKDAKLKASIRKNQDKLISVYEFWHDE